VALRAAAEAAEAELRAAYDADPARYGEPAKATVTTFAKRLARGAPDEQVAAAAESVASFLAAVEQGTSPSAAASAAGLSGLPPFELEERGVDPELRTAAFGLAPGGWSAPTRTSIGWVALRLDSRSPGKVLPFDHVRDAIRIQLGAQRRLELRAQVLGELRSGAAIEDLVEW
jgi:parvulin-like peptidyl-prolyl isomerase